MIQTVTLQDIKTRGSKAIPEENVSYLIVNSKLKVAMLPIEEYNTLIETLEDLEDIKAIEERKNEETISLEEFDKELGL